MFKCVQISNILLTALFNKCHQRLFKGVPLPNSESAPLNCCMNSSLTVVLSAETKACFQSALGIVSLFSNWQAGVPPSGQREVARFEKRRYFIWSAAGQKPGEWWVHPFLPIYRGPGSVSWRRKWQPTPVFLPGKFLRWRRLMGYSPGGRKELDTTEWLSPHARSGGVKPMMWEVAVCVCVGSVAIK